MPRNQKINTRRTIRWPELILALILVAACLIFFIWRGQSAQTGEKAQIHVDGRLVREVELQPNDHYRIDLVQELGVPVSFEVKDGAIRFVDVTCPDHICEKTGFISTEGQTAVCMPNKTAVTILTD